MAGLLAEVVVMVRSELLAAKRLMVLSGDEEADDVVTVPLDIIPLLLTCGGDFSMFWNKFYNKNHL